MMFSGRFLPNLYFILVLLINIKVCIAERECPAGYYGTGCLNRCDHCINSACNAVTGDCLWGCTDDYTGSKCDINPNRECPAGYYGTGCLNRCDHCVNSACNAVTGDCLWGCLDGYTGSKCDINANPECPAGYYGTGCLSRCDHCVNSACNAVTGDCLWGCLDGYTGSKCDINANPGCPAGYYGTGCLNRCDHCINSACNAVTGDCLWGCTDGYTGSKCDINPNRECPAGYYGTGCLNRCDHCVNSACNAVTGDCLWGCLDGYTGSKCDINANPGCPAGYYGTGCLSRCDHCVNSACNAVTGDCLEGCIGDYTGNKCNIYANRGCPAGYYGTGCLSRCDHCVNSACNAITGDCLEGCIGDYTGTKCDIYANRGCPAGYYGTGCLSRCDHCVNSACNAITGDCLEGCIGDYTGTKCDIYANRGCPAGYYGTGCLSRCDHCVNSACNAITGDCLEGCIRDYTGTKCDIYANRGCPVGYYGMGCLSRCDHCVNSACNAITGDCLEGCIGDYTGTKCDIYANRGCPAGYYGMGCLSRCDHCVNSACNVVTGYCLEGCLDGYTGNKCDIYANRGCPAGYYGTGCLSRCDHCVNSACNAITGDCLEGCIGDYTGSKCDIYANPGRLDVNRYPLNTEHPGDGFWPGRLDVNRYPLNTEHPGDGFWPGKFDLIRDPPGIKHPGVHYLPECPKGYYGKGCLKKCAHCVDSACNVITGNCLKGCIYGYAGRKCEFDANEGQYPRSNYRRDDLNLQSDFIPGQLNINRFPPPNDLLGVDYMPGIVDLNRYPPLNKLPTIDYLPGRFDPSRYPGVGFMPDYVGCFKDKRERAMNEMFISSIYMNVDWCRQYCRRNSYMYAAVQYGKQCFCGNGGYNIYGESQNCNVPCPGRRHQMCGGVWASSVYKVRVENYIGCFADRRDRAMRAKITNLMMTVSLCKGYCRYNGYNYAGLQYGSQCFCGNGGYDRYGISDKCEMPCSGSPQEICGGIWASSVYQVRGRFNINRFPPPNDLLGVDYMPGRLDLNRYPPNNLQPGIDYLPGTLNLNQYPPLNELPAVDYIPDRLDMNRYPPINEPLGVDYMPDNILGNLQSDFIPEEQLYNDPGKRHIPDYIGCFADEKERALNQISASSIYMTVDWCKGYCESNGYVYAAVQFQKQCFCGNGDYDIYGKSKQCNMPCPGNDHQICGGKWASSVYQTGKYVGCFIDQEERAMDSKFTTSLHMTIEWCKGYCREHHYLYAALQFGKQCFCGNGDFERYGKSDKCNIHCSGSPHEICGGRWSSSVYKVGDSIGCFRDKKIRAMADSIVSFRFMTIEWCKGYCHYNGYRYAALQYGRKCMCGYGGYDKYGKSKKCNMRCAGNPHETCGGIWSSFVYKVGDYIGCFADSSSRVIKDKITLAPRMTVELCRAFCRKHKYMYAALHFGSQCFCRNEDYKAYGLSDQCRRKCTGNPKEICGGILAQSVYKVGVTPYYISKAFRNEKLKKDDVLPEEYGHIYFEGDEKLKNDEMPELSPTDSADPEEEGEEHEHLPDELPDNVQYLPGHVACLSHFEGWNMKSISILDTLTIPICTKKCEEEGYAYAALQHGNECLCGDDAFMEHIDDDAYKSTECTKLCYGNNQTVCGGHEERSIYKVSGYVGCYEDENNTTLPKNIQESDSMTVTLCRTECRKKGYKYAGLQSGSQCFCGDEVSDESSQSSECVTPCNGDEKNICGGTIAKSVYAVGSHLGCFEVHKNQSFVKEFENENMTIPFCKSECGKHKTEFAALKNSNVCICLNVLHEGNNEISGCDKKCAGEPLTRCGGVDALSIYKIGGYIGCFADNKNRTLQFQESSKNMTVNMCRQLCSENNFKYAGLQFGEECYCGNDGYDKHGASKKCTLKCAGEEDTLCGGNWATSVYVAKDEST